MDLPIEVKLTRPIKLGEQTYDVLSFDEPDLGAGIAYAELEATFPKPEMVKQPDGPDVPVHSAMTAMRANLFWVSQLADIPEAVAKKIKESDLDAVNAAVETIVTSKLEKAGVVGDTSGNEPPAK